MLYPMTSLCLAFSAQVARFFGFESVALTLEDGAVMAYWPAALLWLFRSSDGAGPMA
jgi:hypothetical protein